MKAARLSMTLSGSRGIGDDHNDKNFDDEDGDNVDLHDNEAGLTSYPNRSRIASDAHDTKYICM